MTRELHQLIDDLIKDLAWTVFPPAGTPKPSADPRAPQTVLPDTLLQFYQLCGGMKTNIRSDDDLAVRIVPASSFNWAIKEIIGSLDDDAIEIYRDDILWNCYVIATVGTDEYFVIDLAPERYERCYFTELYFFGHKGWTPIIADSFLELLQRLTKAATGPDKRFWETKNLGDAYGE